MKHKHKSKQDSDSSEDSSSSSRSSSSGSDRRKTSKKYNSNRSDKYELSTNKKKKLESDNSEDDRHKKKTVRSDEERHRKHEEKVRSHSHCPDNKKESKPGFRDKHKETKDSDSRREKYDDRREINRRRDDNRDRPKSREEHDDIRHSHHYRRHERYSEEIKSRDTQERYPQDKRRDRPWNRGRRSRSRSFDHGNAKWGKNDNSDSKSDKRTKEKDKPNFGLSGKLTEETNTYKGVVIKYSEPPEARKPRRRWRLYPFKGEKSLQTLYIHRQSAYLIGRDRKIADLPIDHPSCSKQHAALQYRLVQFTRDDGSVGKRVRPYIIDLESANGTFVNNKKIDFKKYVELLEKDVIKFGFSSREYVLLHENSKDEALDDDVKLEDDEGEVKVKKEEP